MRAADACASRTLCFPIAHASSNAEEMLNVAYGARSNHVSPSQSDAALSTRAHITKSLQTYTIALLAGALTSSLALAQGGRESGDLNPVNASINAAVAPGRWVLVVR